MTHQLTERITIDGREFAYGTERDDFMRAPWEEYDGLGVVSEWTSRDKLPGERVLVKDRNSKRFYNVQATMRVAVRDGWGPQEPGLSKKAAAAKAVETDFERLRAWCNDEWYFMSVDVAPIKANGRPDMDRIESLGGVESDGDYYLEVVKELAGNLIHEDEIEAAEVAFAASLGVRTAQLVCALV